MNSEAVTPEERLAEQSRQLEVQRIEHDAVHAKELLEDQMLTQAFDLMEKTWLRALREFPPDKPEIAIGARLRLDALDEVRRQLKAVVFTGKMVKLEEEQRGSHGVPDED